MKKIVALLFCISMVLWVGPAFGQVNSLNEPGSVLVFPYVDAGFLFGPNPTNTLIKIANQSDDDVTLAYFSLNGNQGFGPQDPCEYTKADGIIELSGKEVFYWSFNNGEGNSLSPLTLTFSNYLGQIIRTQSHQSEDLCQSQQPTHTVSFNENGTRIADFKQHDIRCDKTINKSNNKQVINKEEAFTHAFLLRCRDRDSQQNLLAHQC